MGRKKRRRVSFIVGVNIDHSPRFCANWLRRAVRAGEILRAVRRRDTMFESAMRKEGLARFDLGVCALDVMASVVANGQFEAAVDSLEVKPLLTLKALGFLRGDGTGLVMDKPASVTEKAVRIALKRLPTLILHSRDPGLAKIIQL